MLQDNFSQLYSGFVTCKLDPTFSMNFPSDDDYDGRETDDTVDVYSSDPTILAIMNKYKNVVLPDRFVDISHFVIYLSFEGLVRPLAVPNPLLLRRKFCNVWPFEVKQALGIMGTMQELWIEPVSLLPKGMPSEVSHAIFFEPSARLDGAVCINASRLKADLTYEVNCEDLRGEVMKSLTPEERNSIKCTFDQYDADGNGSVSIAEMEALVKERTDDRKMAIEEKFAEFEATATSQEEIDRAEESKRSYLQHLTESQNKMLKMFNMADVNGDGSLNFTEFLLAEAWWMRCSINPEHAHLF
jgi:Ca2+-binding EF-hand superfamily protein